MDGGRERWTKGGRETCREGEEKWRDGQEEGKERVQVWVNVSYRHVGSR